MSRVHTSEVVSTVSAVEQFRAVPEYHTDRDSGRAAYTDHKQLTEWVGSYDDAQENGMSMLALAPTLEAFHIDKRTRRLPVEAVNMSTLMRPS